MFSAGASRLVMELTRRALRGLEAGPVNSKVVDEASCNVILIGEHENPEGIDAPKDRIHARIGVLIS